MDESEETNSRMSRNQGQTRSQYVDSQGPIMGFCHQCDRQVLIDRVNFVCSVCGGGFIELFEINDQNATNRQATTPSSESNLNRPMISQIRIEGANENLLPLLFPGLLNPLQNAFQSNNSFQQHQSPNPVSFFSSLLGSNLPNQQQQQQQNLPRQGESPRVQLIVPGEQFDLYGVINSVFNELIDPQNRTQPNQFQFQLPNIRMIHMHGDIRDYAWGANGLDTIITQLLNQLENSGPPPASQDQLKNLPEVVINQNDVNNSVQCAICMEDFNLNDKAKKLPCKHLFHEPCIVEWLKLHGTCPVCRKNLNGEDTSQREYIRSPQNNEQATGSATQSNSTSPSGSTQASQSSSAFSRNNTNQNNNSSTNRSNNNNNNNSNTFYEPDFD